MANGKNNEEYQEFHRKTIRDIGPKEPHDTLRDDIQRTMALVKNGYLTPVMSANTSQVATMSQDKIDDAQRKIVLYTSTPQESKFQSKLFKVRKFIDDGFLQYKYDGGGVKDGWASWSFEDKKPGQQFQRLKGFFENEIKAKAAYIKDFVCFALNHEDLQQTK